MTDRPGGYIYICTNKDCGNERASLHLGADGLMGQGCCGLCGGQLKGIGISSPGPGGMLLAGADLSARSGQLGWLGPEVYGAWPGPVAFEYIRLREIMAGGNIEAACWKIANLAETVTYYLFSAALEVGGAAQMPMHSGSVNEKSKFAGATFRGQGLSSLFEALRAVMSWRNKFGVGHGSLVYSKESYTEDLLRLTLGLNKGLKALGGFLKAHGMTLLGPGGQPAAGPDYFFSLQGGTVSEPAACINRPGGNENFKPVMVFSCHFDGPDIYFIDSYFYGILRYRNFRNNRSKHIRPDRGICWEASPEQVAWLDSAERDSWQGHFFPGAGRGQAAPQVKTALVEAAEQFQSRGMAGESRWCMGLIERCGPAPDDDILGQRLSLVRYGIEASLGNEPAAQAALQGAPVGAGAEGRLFLARAKILQSWHRGVYGRLGEALDLCSSAIEDIDSARAEYPYLSSLYALEVRKNILYLSSRLPERDAGLLREECMKLFQDACELHIADPDSRRAVDIIGFACNLYGEYGLEVMGEDISTDSWEVQEILDLYDYGEKIRARYYRACPDDIWASRGYAWSLHVLGRFFRGIKILKDALPLLEAALEIRLRCEGRYPEDLGLKEDIIKNLAEIMGLGLLGEGEKRKCAQAIFDAVGFIISKEGNSPRIKYLKRELGRVAPGEDWALCFPS